MIPLARSRLRGLALAGLLAFGSCAPPAEDSAASAGDEMARESTARESTAQQDLEGIRATIAREVESANAADVEAFIGTLTDDVVVIAPGQPMVRGPDAHQWARDFMAAASVRIDVYEEVDLEVLVDEAIHVYEFQWTVTPNQGESVTEQGHGIHILRRTPDGWRISHDIWSTSAAPSGM